MLLKYLKEVVFAKERNVESTEDKGVVQNDGRMELIRMAREEMNKKKEEAKKTKE